VFQLFILALLLVAFTECHSWVCKATEWLQAILLLYVANIIYQARHVVSMGCMQHLNFAMV